MSDTEIPGQRDETLIAAVDCDQGEWRLAISDGGRPDFSVQPDAGEVQKTIGGFPILVATEECRGQLSRSTLELRPRYVRRLQAIANSVPEAAAGCLALWMGRSGASCGRIEASRIAGDQVDDPRFSPRGLFDCHAESAGSLKAWLAAPQRRQDEIVRAFESFLANLKDGTVNKVGPTPWMKGFQRLPEAFVSDGVRRVLTAVDPEHSARLLVLAGWARAARWDLGERIAAELPGITVLQPSCDPFTESLTGLIEDELARQKRPRLETQRAPARPRPAENSRKEPAPAPPPNKETPPAPQPAPAAPPPEKETPPVAAPPSVAPPIEETPPAPAPAPTPPPKEETPSAPAPEPPPQPSEAEVLCARPAAQIAVAVAALVESLGVRAAGPAVTLADYLQVGKGCAQAAAGDAAAVPGLRKSLEDLENKQKKEDEKDYRCDLFELLDCVTPGDAGTEVERRATALKELARIVSFGPEAGDIVAKTDNLQVLTSRGEGRWVRIVSVHKRGYSFKRGPGLDDVTARKPLVDVVRYDKKSSRWSVAFLREHLLLIVCGAILLLSIVFLFWRLAQREAGLQQVGGVVDAGEPVVSMWGVAGTPLVVALTRGAGAPGCHLRIWRAPAWDAPAVLPAPCGPAAVSPDGEFAAWGSPENLPTVTRTSDNIVWRNMGPPERRHSTPLSALAFAADGQTLYSASNDGAVRSWSTRDGEYIRDLPSSSSRPVRTMLVADASFVAAGEAAAPARVRVWAPQCPDPILLGGASAEITALAYDSEARMIIGGDADGEVLGWAWEAPSCQGQSSPVWRRRQMDRTVQTILPARGSRLYIDYSDAVLAWRFGAKGVEDDGESLDPKNPISGAAVVDDGETTLLATADDRNVRLWRIAR
jgi:outer membrane biosynthesis protein TonB